MQQTQIATVIPYFERFMQRFPDVYALAAGSLDEVLKLWEGLGYYSRARNMHRAAQEITTRYGGRFPQTVPELMKLPGIGRYTAGAIASIALGENVAVVDGNVIRVLARWFAISDDVALDSTKQALWSVAEELLPGGQAGAWNEALMELGQQICAVKNPACDRCPVANFCAAFQTGTQAKLPVRAARKALPHYEVAAGIIYDDDDHILIAKRFPKALLGGLWEFPGGKREPGETLPECLAREIKEELAIEVEVGPQIAVVRHSYTHFKITLHAFECRYLGGKPQAIGCAEWAWTVIDDLNQFAFPRTNHKIIAALKTGSQLGFGITS